jgi:hypothetical protein
MDLDLPPGAAGSNIDWVTQSPLHRGLRQCRAVGLLTMSLTLASCSPNLSCGEGTTQQGQACVADEGDSDRPACGAGTRFNGLVCVPFRDAGAGPLDASVADSGPGLGLDGAVAPECQSAGDCTLPPDGGTRVGAQCLLGYCLYPSALECVDASDCARSPLCGAAAATCQAGRCVRPPDAGTECDAGTCCAGVCVDTRTQLDHCGQCGLDCGAGGSCLAGACRTVVADLGASTSTRAWLVPVAGEVFVTLPDRLLKVLDAQPASVLVLAQFPPLSTAPQLVLGPDHVYLWAPSDGGVQVIQVPRSGPGQVQVVLDQCNATALALDPSLLMVAGNNCLGATNAIVRVPLDGGAPTFAVGGPGDFGGSALRMSLQGTDVYWRGSYVQGSGIYAKSAAGADTPRQITADPAPFGLMMDDRFVYWLAGGLAANGCLVGANLRRASLAGTGQTDAVIGLRSAAQHRHVLVGTTAWWDDCDGTIVAVDVDTGASHRVLGGSTILGLAVDETKVWAVERTPGNAVRLVKTAR